MRLSIPPNTSPPALSEIEAIAVRLNRELERADSPEERALLLNELAVLEELARDDQNAAQHWLTAVNAQPTLREPLEQLLSLIERRRSFQNLGKLFDRLGRIANSEPELVRAQSARADFLCDHKQDYEAARAAYDLVLNTDSQQPGAWLGLQYLAARLHDERLTELCVAARVELAREDAYRGWLHLALARQQRKQGRLDAAARALEQALQRPSPARFAALQEQESLAQRSNRSDLLVSALDGQAQMLTAAWHERSRGVEGGVPHALVNAHAAAEAWLRAALQRLLRGETDDAINALERAIAVCPDQASLRYASMLARLAAGDRAGAVRTASVLLEDEAVEGVTRAAVLLRRASSAEASPDEEPVWPLLSEALRCDPHGVAVHAAALHWAERYGEPAQQAEVYESFANALGDDAQRMRYDLLAAWAFSGARGEADAARAALSQAALAGAAPTTMARIARLLALRSNDLRWYDEAGQRLLKLAGTEEHLAVAFDGFRRQLLRQERGSAKRALATLTAQPAGAWLGSLLGSFTWSQPAQGEQTGHAAQSNLANATTSATAKRNGPRGLPEADAPAHAGAIDSLLRLATLCEPADGVALQQLAARRLSLAQRDDEALQRLERLHQRHPEQFSIAEQLASLLRRQDELARAAQVLSQCAWTRPHQEVALAYALEAGILYWQSGDRTTALSCFENASELDPELSSGLLHWALCSASPDDIEHRRRALQAAAEHNGDADVHALERFALEIGIDARAATQYLDAADEVALGEVGASVNLARALWPASKHHTSALNSLESVSAESKQLVHTWRYYRARLDPQRRDDWLELARQWAAHASLAGSLEWLGLAYEMGDSQQQAGALLAVARQLDGEARAATLAAAAMLGHITGEAEGEPWVEAEGVAAQLANLEFAPPGSDPTQRARALNEGNDALGEEHTMSLLLLAAYNELAIGQYESALATFKTVVDAHPDGVAAWEGLRSSAESLGRSDLAAEACEHLGELCRNDDATRAARFFQRAAVAWLDELNDPERGLLALEQANALDVSDYEMFDRWFRHLRDAGRHDELVQLCSRRLEIADAPKELTRLYWERARAQRALEDTDAALIDLAHVRLLEPEHVGARALAAEIYMNREQYTEAATQLAELTALPSAPENQRLMSGVAAVDLYETKLGDLSRALEILAELQRAGLSALAVKERLARATARAGRWSDASRMLEDLMSERQTVEGRVQAARLSLVIHRDRLQQPAAAGAAVETLLRLAPADPEGLDFVLDDHLEESLAESLLRQAKLDLFESLRRDADVEQAARLARIAEFIDDLPLRQLALSLLLTLGVNSGELRHELAQLDHRSQHHPVMAIDEAAIEAILHPEDRGPLARLMQLLAPTVSEVVGPTLKSLGLGRRQRVRPPAGTELRADIAAWCGALQLDEFELYRGGPEREAMIAIASDGPAAFVFGEDLVPPLAPRQRARLASLVLALRRGTTLLLSKDVTAVAALLVAACRVGGVRLESPPYALTTDFERLLSRHLPRRVRREVATLAQAAAKQDQSPIHFAHAARASLDRIAVVAVGDISWLLLSDEERKSHDRHLDAPRQQRAEALLDFVLSLPYLQLRERLGLAAR